MHIDHHPETAVRKPLHTAIGRRGKPIHTHIASWKPQPSGLTRAELRAIVQKELG